MGISSSDDSSDDPRGTSSNNSDKKDWDEGLHYKRTAGGCHKYGYDRGIQLIPIHSITFLYSLDNNYFVHN